MIAHLYSYNIAHAHRRYLSVDIPNTYQYILQFVKTRDSEVLMVIIVHHFSFNGTLKSCLTPVTQLHVINRGWGSRLIIFCVEKLAHSISYGRENCTNSTLRDRKICLKYVGRKAFGKKIVSIFISQLYTLEIIPIYVSTYLNYVLTQILV